MRILYGIQGTGNGHLSRARDIIPVLQKYGDLDLLVSGVQADVQLPYEVKYRHRGFSFIFGKMGGVDLWRTWKNSRSRALWNNIRNLPVEDYDLVISDFEPVTAWACKVKGRSAVGLSHQIAVTKPNAPKPEKPDLSGRWILNHYAPTRHAYGFHFHRWDQETFTPIIRRSVRNAETGYHDHITVYLPSYQDKFLLQYFSQMKEVQWQVFSKHNKKAIKCGNVHIAPINDQAFVRSMATGLGVLCGAGFETPAETLFLNKQLMVVPMKWQYEQHCNAAALKSMGVPVIKGLRQNFIPQVRSWIKRGETIPVQYPNQTNHIIDQIISTHSPSQQSNPLQHWKVDHQQSYSLSLS